MFSIHLCSSALIIIYSVNIHHTNTQTHGTYTQEYPMHAQVAHVMLLTFKHFTAVSIVTVIVHVQ